MQLDLKPCTPPQWAKGAHVQTIYTHLKGCQPVNFAGEERKIIPLADGDRLTARYVRGTSPYVVYFFHGLTGDNRADYIEQPAKACFDNGHSIYLVNHRGCGDGDGLARGPYHSGRGEDISDVIAFGRRENPDKKHLAVGFSLSGNALLCLLSGIRGDVKPDLALSINAPIDLKATSAKLTEGWNRIYDLRFNLKLRQVVHRRQRLGTASVDSKIPFWGTLREFDDCYTAPAGGFKNALDYYKSCSTHESLHKIQTPTVVLMSKDDPFVAFEPYARAQLSDSVHLHVEEVGGHMGYVCDWKTPNGNRRWLDYAVAQSIRALTAQTSTN